MYYRVVPKQVLHFGYQRITMEFSRIQFYMYVAANNLELKKNHRIEGAGNMRLITT